MSNEKSISLKGLGIFKEESDNAYQPKGDYQPAGSYATTAQLEGKVDKETGKGLSTNDYTNGDKAKVAAALTQHQDISGKVDKIAGKGLSTNDYTNEEKQKVADALVPADIAGKANTSDVYTKEETYSKTEVNGLVDTPHQEYVTVDTYTSLPATGSKDTVYRVSNYNGSTSQVDASVYSEYAWDGTKYVFLCVKSQIGEVFDITAYNNNTKYADLAAALGTGGEHVPESLRKGGMSIKFVQSSDNKYVQYRLMADEWSTVVTDWQGVDDEPTLGSNNLVKSGGIFAMEYNKDTYSFIKRLFNTSLYDGAKYKRAGYYIKNDGSGQQNSDYDLWIIQTWTSGTDDIKAFVVETTYTNPVEDVPTVQIKETESLTPENVINVSYKRGTNKILVSVSPSDTCKILTVVCDANTVPTINVLSPKYDIYDERILQLINEEIVESVSFTSSYGYTNDKFYPIPKGSVITGVSGASTSVNGYNTDKSDHVTLAEGVVVPYQIDFLRSTSYTGQITLKYKSLCLSELAEEKTRAIAAENSLNEEIGALDELYQSVFNESVNLANPDDFEEGYYVSYETGRLSENSNYTSSGYIPVTAGQSYYISYKHQIAWYKEDKTYLSGSPKSDSVKVQVAPSGAKYLRCTIGNDAVSTFIIAQSSQAIPYTPYGDTIKENAIAPNSIAPDKLKPQSPVNKAYFNAIGNVASGDMIDTTDFPFFVKKGLAIAFYAKITSFDTLYIGKGYNKYRGHWVKIDNTNITVEWYESSVTTIATAAHGLTLSTYIKVNIVQNNDGTTDIVLQTLGGDFKYTVTDASYEWNYELFVRSTNTILTDAMLTATIQDIDKPVWLFGDSYFGVNDERVIGQLKNLGLFNYLVEGLAGEDSIGAYADLQRLIVLGKPKYIVWCLGMNDTDANFTTCFNNVKSYCERYGITMIGYTVPTVPSRNKETISALVRNSGLRYIDAYKAVGTDADGNWYAGYLSSDGVHPTTRGAKAIAMQWTVDFPELYIYCRYNDNTQLSNYGGGDN